MSDKVRVKVVGPLPVAGVSKPGTVDLDPEKVNIPALVRAGHVELPKSKRSEESGE